MQTIDMFFQAKADAFSAGHIKSACSSVALPTTVYFEDRVLFVSNHDNLTKMLGVYYNRLNDSGHNRTSCDVTSTEPLSNDGVRANVRWTHLTKSQNAIHSVDMTYFCKIEDEAWKIALVEVAGTPDKVLMAGAPFS